MWHKLGIQVEQEDTVNLFISKQYLNIPNVYIAGFKHKTLLACVRILNDC